MERTSIKTTNERSGIDSIPLRFNLSNEQWINVQKKKTFKDTTITRRLGKKVRENRISKWNNI